MKNPIANLVSAVSGAFLFTGCTTVDLVSKHSGPPPVCEVHHVEMSPEMIDVSSGEAVYLWDYREIARTRFPHHGRMILSNERGYRHEFTAHVRDFVCSECTRAYEEFWRKPRFRESG